MTAVRFRRAVAIGSMPALVVVAAAVLVPACTGEWSFALPPVEGGVPDPRFAVPCAAWAAAYCSFHHRCDGFFFTWQTEGQCQDREQIFCQLSAVDPNVAFDEAIVASCQYPDDCTGALPVCWPRGHAATGAPCLASQDCVSGICSGAQSSETVCGVCACGTGCATNQICNIGLDGGTCVMAALGSGAQCSTDGECASTLCAPVDGGGAICAPFVEEGGVCLAPAPLCDTGLYCNVAGRCAVPVRVGYGAACGSPGDGGAATFCTSGASCLGACVAPASDGEECDPTVGVGCIFPAKCVARRCIFPTLSDCSP